VFTHLRVRDIALIKSWIMISLQSICTRVQKLGRDKSPCWDQIIAFPIGTRGTREAPIPQHE